MTTYGIGHWYIELTKQAFWRGAPHVWNNRYVLSGADPSAAVALSTINDIHAIENALYPHVAAAAGVGFVEGRAYKSTGHAPFATTPYNISLAPASATGFGGPSVAYTSLAWSNQLESCLDARGLLPGLSISGKPVYCRKFYRGFSHTVGEDLINTPIAAADLSTINENLNALTSGTGLGGYTVIGLAQAVSPAAFSAQPFLGNHQIPRGKKKKKITVSQAQVQAALNPS